MSRLLLVALFFALFMIFMTESQNVDDDGLDAFVKRNGKGGPSLFATKKYVVIDLLPIKQAVKNVKLSTAGVPTHEPTEAPSEEPTYEPTEVPSSSPSSLPTSKPTSHPSSIPTSLPSSQPSVKPSSRPSSQPSSLPSSQPSAQPSGQPTGWPSGQPTGEPTAPSFRPTFQPYSPTNKPTSLVTEVVAVDANYTLDSIFALELNNVSIATITAAILKSSPSTANVRILRIYRVAISSDTRRLLASSLSAHSEPDIVDLSTISYSYAAIVRLLFNLVDFPGLNATTVARQQSELIKQVALNGTFQSVLRQLAQANNASQLFNITVRDVQVAPSIIAPPTFAPTASPGSSRTARLTDGQIAGLVIGTVVGSFCLVTLLYYSVITKRKISTYSYPDSLYQENAATQLQGGYYDEAITINLGEDSDNIHPSRSNEVAVKEHTVIAL